MSWWTNSKYKHFNANRQRTFVQRRINVDATSWCCIDVNATLYKWDVPAANAPVTSNTDIMYIHFQTELNYWRGRQFCQNCCFSSEKGSVLKRKNLLPLLSRSFSFRVDPFQKGLDLQDGKLEVTKKNLPCKNGRKKYHVHQISSRKFTRT